jgi:hypothetical protein
MTLRLEGRWERREIVGNSKELKGRIVVEKEDRSTEVELRGKLFGILRKFDEFVMMTVWLS